MNLLNLLLKSMLTDSSVSALAKKTGISKTILKKLIPLAIPLLLKHLTQNASTQTGAQALLGALTQHTSTKAMHDQLDEADETDGGKILNHILGDASGQEIGKLASETGLSKEEVSRALGGMTPALLSSLSAATNTAAKVDLSDGLDLSDVMAMLGGAGQASSATGLLGSLLGGKPAAQSGAAGLFGSLLGGAGTAETDSSINGTALLQSLTALMK